MSRLAKNSGQAVRIVKYMSSFRLVFSRENLQPRRNVIIRSSSKGSDLIIKEYFASG